MTYGTGPAINAVEILGALITHTPGRDTVTLEGTFYLVAKSAKTEKPASTLPELGPGDVIMDDPALHAPINFPVFGPVKMSSKWTAKTAEKLKDLLRSMEEDLAAQVFTSFEGGAPKQEGIVGELQEQRRTL